MTSKSNPSPAFRTAATTSETLTGLSVSRSTLCRAIARLGPTRKKGDE